MFKKLFLILALSASTYYFIHKPVNNKSENNDDDIFATMHLYCSN